MKSANHIIKNILIGVAAYLAVITVVSLVFSPEQLQQLGMIMSIASITGILPGLVILIILVVASKKGLTGSKTERADFAEGFAHHKPMIRGPYIVALAVLALFLCFYIFGGPYFSTLQP